MPEQSASMNIRRTAIVLFLLPLWAYANVVLPPIISDHMVLEKSPQTSIWGTADADEEVTVSLDGKSAASKADAAGKWLVKLDLKDSASGPFELVVKGKNEIRVKDVVVGDVWVAAGQSNMQFTLKDELSAKEEIAQSANPMLRHFKVELVASPDPLAECKGEWIVATPQTSHEFTAIGYYFAKTLQKELGIPIGLINASWGGTRVEAWASSEAQRAVPELKATVESQTKAASEFPALQKTFVEKFAEWLKSNSREDKRDASASDFLNASTEGWTTIKLPGIPDAQLGAGAVWYRKTIEVPARSAGKILLITVGEITGFEEVYWNGEQVGKMTYENFPGNPYARRFDIPANLVKEGPNVLAIRVFSPDGAPALVGKVFKAGPVNLNGEWLTKTEYQFPPLAGASPAPEPPVTPPPPQAVPGALFNGMINPILAYTIKGVIWYQGESNASRAHLYHTTFPLLIQDWRARWAQPDLPFYFCQLANYMPKKDLPGEANWAELREAQSLALKIPHTGQAVLIDTGEAEGIHPLNKKDGGERLAKSALAQTYGKKIPFSGPVPVSHAVEGDKIRLKFTHADGGLVARELPATYNLYIPDGLTAPLVKLSPQSELQGFAICGEDQKWVWADAKIDGDSVVVWAKDISAPVAVRYGWADNPTLNLYNGAGLPASPFRTDNFAVGVGNRKK